MTNNTILHNTAPQMSGEFTIEVRDADTLELKNTINSKNVITEYGYGRILGQFSYSIATGSSSQSSDTIYVSDQKHGPVQCQNIIGGNLVRRSQTLIPPTWVVVNQNQQYVYTQQRFNAPGTGITREINTILLGSDDLAGYQHIAYTGLELPCFQQENEVLDITYRITMNFQELPENELVGLWKEYGWNLAYWYFTGSGNGLIYETKSHWNSKIPSANKYQTPTTNSYEGENFASPSHVYDNSAIVKRKFAVSRGERDNVGNIFGMFGYGNNYCPAWAPATSETFPNKPIQNIFLHNADAVDVFQDVDFLGAGQGQLNVNGDNWPNDSWPELYRVEYKSSGSVGNSRYFFRRRNTIGFYSSVNGVEDVTVYGSAREKAPWRHTSSLDTPYVQGVNSIVGLDKNNTVNYHGLSSGHARIEEYNSTTIITWDDLGILIQDLVNPDNCVYFNSTSTPQMNVSSVCQVGAAETGEVYVACRAMGIYKISDPFGTPTVTNVIAVPAYGVAVGYNGRVWAATQNGLEYSDNGGTTWTTLTPLTTPSFTHPDIDGNLGNIQYIKVDRQAPTHELGIVFNTGSGWYLYWYTSTNGGQLTKYTSYQVDYSDYNKVRCSYRGSMWCLVHREGSSSVGERTRRVTFGTETGSLNVSKQYLGYNSLASSVYNQPSYQYDYYGTPLITAPGWDSSNTLDARHAHIATHNGESLCEIEEHGYTVSYTHHMPFALEHNPSAVNLHITPYNNSPLKISVGLTQDFGQTQITTAAERTLAHKDTAIQEAVWKTYRWTGSQWSDTYCAPAIDTSGNNYTGQRHNFDIEDHRFTGRSMIDASDVFATGNFGNNATFVFKLTPQEKKNTNPLKISNSQNGPNKAQEYEPTIFEIADTTTDQRLKLVWNTTDGTNAVDNVILVDGTSNTDVETVLGATPANDVTCRFVVAVSGTTAQAYLDGAAFGSPVTLSQPLDMTNANNALHFYLGSQVYQWDYQKHSPMQTNFYRGIMENVQVWNNAWTQTEVTSDFTNIDGVIVDSGNNLVARYQLTDDLTGTETKVTHANNETMVNGITIGFVDGTSGTSFIEAEYHTFGVVDGILKDNATTFSQQFEMYLRPTDVAFTEFTQPTGANTISSSSMQVEETACWTDKTRESAATPGQFGRSYFYYISNANRPRVSTIQKIIGDGWFEAAIGASSSEELIGLTATPIQTADNFNGVEFGLYFASDGSVTVRESGVNVATSVASYTARDKFRVRRAGTTVYYEKYNTSTSSYDIFYTSLVASSGSLYGTVILSGTRQASIYDAKINWTQPAYVMRAGTLSTQTGAYSPTYLLLDDDNLGKSISINIDGVPATVVTWETAGLGSRGEMWWDNMPTPGPGEVVINSRSGHLIFNPADAGKTVTGQVPIIYTKVQ